MNASSLQRIRTRFTRFSLRTLLLLMSAVCVFAYLDPLGWRLPPPVPIRTVQDGETAKVDLIELNRHYFDDSQRAQFRVDHFDQLLFWSIYPDGQLHVRAFRALRDPTMLPRRDGNTWVCTWTESGANRQIEAPAFRETKSISKANDPELADRNSLPAARRTKLRVSR
jgi:hypothetical protein